MNIIKKVQIKLLRRFGRQHDLFMNTKPGTYQHKAQKKRMERARANYRKWL